MLSHFFKCFEVTESTLHISDQYVYNVIRYALFNLGQFGARRVIRTIHDKPVYSDPNRPSCLQILPQLGARCKHVFPVLLFLSTMLHHPLHRYIAQPVVQVAVLGE